MNANEVSKPITVSSMVLDPQRLPDWQRVIADIPVGTGLKGGLARKILKVISGLNRHDEDFVSEMNGDGDIDVLVAVPKVTPALRRELREKFAGQMFGGMVVEPKDVEVSDNLSHYFRSRDVTMNEALVFRASEDEVLLFYTDQAAVDIVDGAIRPAIHTLHNGFKQVWQFGSHDEVIPTPAALSRSIIRLLKGHGTHYAIEQAVWQHYNWQTNPFELRDLFRIFKSFKDDGDKYYTAFRHVVELGLISDDTCPFDLWADMVSDTVRRLARHGHRFTFTEPNVNQIEAWVDRKADEYFDWQMKRTTLASIGQFLEPDYAADVYLPGGVDNYPAFFTERLEDVLELTCTQEPARATRFSFGAIRHTFGNMLSKLHFPKQ